MSYLVGKVLLYSSLTIASGYITMNLAVITAMWCNTVVGYRKNRCEG
jgi:hypothetical protein